jgi:hypothetical protein
MRRPNVVRGFHRFLLVMWLAWGLTIIGAVTWIWWEDPWRSQGPIETVYVPGDKIEAGGFVPDKQWQIIVNLTKAGPLTEQDSARITAEIDAGRWRVPCCWAPWAYLSDRARRMPAFEFLVLGPGVVYAGLIGMALALRWAWLGSWPPSATNDPRGPGR